MPRQQVCRPCEIGGRTPQFFERVDNIEHDCDRNANIARCTLDTLDVVALTFDEHDMSHLKALAPMLDLIWSR